MARPAKQGLDYYPKDVKAKYDTKFKYIESENSVIARLVIYELWDLIYGEHGYYVKFDKIQKVLFLHDLPISNEQLENILVSCFEINMFDQEIYQKYEVLTSESIQRRYLEAVGRRAKVHVFEEYLLVDKKSYRNIYLVNVNNNPVNVDNNSQNVNDNTQSKVKKIKEKKSKENNSNTTTTKSDISKIFEFYESNGFGSISSKTMQDFEYWIKDLEQIGATTEDAIELIILAMGEAVNYNKRSYAYVNRVLIDWEQKRYINASQVKASNKKKSMDNKLPIANTSAGNLEVDY